MSDDLILMPEVEARRLLCDRPIHFRMLAPYGSWIGCGKLRVLRLRVDDSAPDLPPERRGVELTVGYEAYRS